jgi:hypothetical protein
MATATASGQSTGGGAVNVTASATGGSVAAGGLATATATGRSTGSGAVDATASATGGGGGAAGAANAYATGVARKGNVQANASANGGGGVIAGTAFARSRAKNSNGEALTSVSAPGGSGSTSPSALTAAGIGSVSLAPARIAAGQAVSNAVLTGPGIGEGAMSAGYGGSSAAVEYEATAVFDFTTLTSETLDLTLLSDSFSGAGFDSLELKVIVDGTAQVYRRSRLAGAERLFTSDALDLGTLAARSQTIKLEYFLDYNSGTSAGVGDGFGFAYDLAIAPVAATFASAAPVAGGIPEPSTWAMMLIGFTGLAIAGYRASRRSAAIAA